MAASIRGWRPPIARRSARTIATLREFRSFWLIAVGCGFTAFGGYGIGNFLPPFVERIHGVSGTDLGILMAFGGGGAGLAGTYLGGRIADLLGRRDPRWYLWQPALAGLVALPLIVPMLLWAGLWAFVPLMVVVTALTNSYLGPCLATCQALVPPAMRSLTSAILLFVLNLIGLGLGPLIAGALSDAFSRDHGVEGIRYALVITALIAGLGIVFLVAAARRLPEDLARGEARLAAREGLESA